MASHALCRAALRLAERNGGTVAAIEYAHDRAAQAFFSGDGGAGARWWRVVGRTLDRMLTAEVPAAGRQLAGLH